MAKNTGEEFVYRLRYSITCILPPVLLYSACTMIGVCGVFVQGAIRLLELDYHTVRMANACPTQAFKSGYTASCSFEGVVVWKWVGPI